MTYWLTIGFIVCLAICVSIIEADVEQMNGADTKTNSLTDSSKDSLANNDRLIKRASFMPSRGKKEQGQMDDNVEEAEKRASAFMHMRGRKDGYYGEPQPQQHAWYVGAPAYDFQNSQDDKRAGFMPMRGRKDGSGGYDSVPASNFYDDVYPMELNDMKRAGFMPMRGRKDDQGYLQMYGQPMYAVPQPYRQSIQSIDNTNWMEGQHGLIGSRSGNAVSGGGGGDGGPELQKKANAFFGARGKRSVPTDNQIAQHKKDGEEHHKYNENFFATRG